MIGNWQEIVDLLAEIMQVPSASIMRVEPPQVKVFVSSASKGNPCEPGAIDTGPSTQRDPRECHTPPGGT
jgi:hypothetical protein